MESADQQQPSERGTTRAKVLLALVAVVGLMVGRSVLGLGKTSNVRESPSGIPA